jgi:hypothetical protein
MQECLEMGPCFSQRELYTQVLLTWRSMLKSGIIIDAIAAGTFSAKAPAVLLGNR